MSELRALLLEDAEHAAACGKMVRDLERYTTLPAQRAKVAKLVAHAGCGARILATLRQVRYREGELDPFLVNNLFYWGLVLVALLDRDHRLALLRDLMDGAYTLPHREQQLVLLHATVQAVLPFAADDPEFAERAQRLAAFEAERRGATESVAWARALALPFAERDDWQVTIHVPHASNAGIAVMAPTLIIEIRPHPDFAWSVHFQDPRNRRYSERPHGVAQDDVGLPPIKRFEELPTWLRDLPADLRFDSARAEVRGAKTRAAAQRIADWLAGA